MEVVMTRSWKGTALPLGAAAALLIAVEAAGCAGDEFTPLPSTTGTGTSGQAGHGGDGGSGAGASGGAGGAGGQECSDGDMDGVTDCAGDCDDGDPLTYPGAPEVCGDAKDNACGSDPDPSALCKGKGTFVAQGAGDDANPGTQEAPLATIGQGILNAVDIGAGVDVYVAEGNYGEKIVMAEGHDLLGGHHCPDASNCTWQRDPPQFQAIISTTDAEGIVAGVTITRATRLDGFSIVGWNGAPPVGSNVVTAVLVYQGTPTISNNRIAGGNAASCAGYCGSEGVKLLGPSNNMQGALIENNEIEGGASPNWCSALTVEGQAGAEIRGNILRGGTGDWSRTLIVGGQAGPPVLVDNNDIYAGACAGSGDTTFGVFVGGYVDVTLNDNRVNADQGQVGACPGCNITFWCGGLESDGGTVELTNNVIAGVDDAPRSTAVFLGDGETPIGSVSVNGNVLHGMGAPSGAVSAAIAFRSTFQNSVNAVAGRIRNNILVAGHAANRYGLFEDNSPGGRTCKPEALDNNDFYFPIASGATNDNMWRLWNGSAPSTIPTIAMVNGAPVDNGTSTAAGNFSENPLLDGSGHLSPGSPCIDAGTATEAPATDMDGEPRPNGSAVDVGADETG
jgi:hypothetical protein